MPKSIRVSDEIYELAQEQAQLQTRSLAQQIEHWAKLGMAVEASEAGQGVARAAVALLSERRRPRASSSKPS